MKTRNVLMALAAVAMFPVAALGGGNNPGICEELEQDVLHQGILWDSLQSCTPIPPDFTYDTVRIIVRSPDQDPISDFSEPLHVVCALN